MKKLLFVLLFSVLCWAQNSVTLNGVPNQTLGFGSANAALFLTNAQTATYQVVANDFAACKTIPVASGTFTITLVASGTQPASGQCITILNYGTGVVTLARSGQNINGAASNLTGTAGSATAPTGWYVVSDGTNYVANVLGGSSGGGTTAPLTLTSGNTNTTPQLSITDTSGDAVSWLVSQPSSGSPCIYVGSGNPCAVQTIANGTNFVIVHGTQTSNPVYQLRVASTFAWADTFTARDDGSNGFGADHIFDTCCGGMGSTAFPMVEIKDNGSAYYDFSTGSFRLIHDKGQHLHTQAATNDVSGTIAISSSTSASVSFTSNYSTAPSCTLTPTSDPTAVGVWWVTTATSSVTANIKVSGTITFNYLCIGNPN